MQVTQRSMEPMRGVARACVMSETQTLTVTTTFFVAREWSLVETSDGRVRVLRQGHAMEGCDWASHEMYRAIAEFRKLAGRDAEQPDGRP